MRMKKRILGFFLTVILVMSLNSIVFASEYPSNVGMEVDGSILTDSSETESVKNSLTRGNFLNSGVARLTDMGSGTVNSYGAVVGAVICDKMVLEMTLQRLEGNTWVTVKSFSDTKYNTSLLTKSYNTSVKKGYYYRLKAACVAFEGGTSESQMPVTDGIWID
ncbi:MAG TPA: hypothetical protein H9935_05200 [Candidatus Blautia merdigallinarum]|uniref:Uncharacterized protein n=1 Tax=Candidatus Blautia merdigallinarum TaxID=2838495 RepID=A0A9D2SJ06_9FIRM|nr:hypothetical protein [Candidatus Blautia merdigallinarum]